ncbi:MAG: methyltransferase domain-containing protein [Candidatus Eisenbacteria sp.]|nr:methyltransferase domain-containing protein [Candidatus Eisenbacteria bacterium]
MSFDVVRKEEMARNRDSHSPRPAEVSEHYASGYEADRLNTGAGRLDRERSRELLKRFLPPAPATVLDIGGGPGGHACWLARQGYEVHLIDISPLHVQLAREASASQPEAQLASASVGDACSLSWDAETGDTVLLFGPLYHLTDKKDRLKALQEAYRVIKPGGILLAVGISRFASTFDGLRGGLLKDSQFAEIVYQDLKSGQHRNPTAKPEYFMDAFFHHPDELRSEVAGAGFNLIGVYGVEGPCWLLRDFDDWWNDEERRNRLLHIARATETEASLLGVSAHLIAVGRK